MPPYTLGAMRHGKHLGGGGVCVRTVLRGTAGCNVVQPAGQQNIRARARTHTHTHTHTHTQNLLSHLEALRRL